MGDRTNGLGDFSGVIDALMNKLPAKFMGLADEARDASRQAFPGQAWDNTQQNAARHAIWTGRMAQELGAGNGGWLGALAAAGAKGLGHINELSSAYGLFGKSGREDTDHDLNNNFFGAELARKLGDQGVPAEKQRELLIQTLLEHARKSQVTPAPAWAAPAVTLTRGQ